MVLKNKRRGVYYHSHPFVSTLGKAFTSKERKKIITPRRKRIAAAGRDLSDFRYEYNKKGHSLINSSMFLNFADLEIKN
jgi:hypothetical protein